MQPTPSSQPRFRWLALTVLVHLCLASGGAAAQAGGAAPATPLHGCPSVKEEIVDLDVLAEGLKKSQAVGLFEKLRLKSAIDELVGRMRAHHAGDTHYTLAELQEQYDALMMRIASQLQDKDLALHARLCNAWDPIWLALKDPGRFKERFS